MNYVKLGGKIAGGVAFLCLASGAFAQTVQFTITGGNAPSGTWGIMGGTYTSPYTGYLNNNSGNALAIICDDFADEVYLGESWTALATNVADINSSTTNQLYFDQGDVTLQQQQYMVASYLAEQLLTADAVNPGDQTTVGELSFALWGVFDPTLLTAANPAGLTGTLSTGQLGAAIGYLDNAESAVSAAISGEGQSAYLSTFANVELYSATTNGTTAEAENPSRPQEFIVVNMPEPSAPSLILIDLLGAAGLVFFARRWRARSASRS
jgi:hypothetical protein